MFEVNVKNVTKKGREWKGREGDKLGFGVLIKPNVTWVYFLKLN